MKRTALALAGLLFVCTAGCGLFVKRLPSGEVPHPTAKDRFIRAGNIKYHYIEYPAAGRVVFLLHGICSSTYSWEGVAPLLQQKGLHVYALDMKGFGWSEKPADGDYGPLALVDGVNAWMDAVGLRRMKASRSLSTRRVGFVSRTWSSRSSIGNLRL